MIFLYVYLTVSACFTLGLIISLALSDIRGEKDIKFGYNFSHNGKFQINPIVWIVLFPTLPVVNLWFLYVTVRYRLKFGKWL